MHLDLEKVNYQEQYSTKCTVKKLYTKKQLILYYQQLIQKAIDELELSPLAMPDIDVKEISKENGVTFEAVVTVKPDVELGEYKT